MALVLAGATRSNSHDLRLWRGVIVVLAYLFGSLRHVSHQIFNTGGLSAYLWLRPSRLDNLDM